MKEYFFVVIRIKRGETWLINVVVVIPDEQASIHDPKEVQKVQYSGDDEHDSQSPGGLEFASADVVVVLVGVIPRETGHAAQSDERSGSGGAEQRVQRRRLDPVRAVHGVGQQDERRDEVHAEHGTAQYLGVDFGFVIQILTKRDSELFRRSDDLLSSIFFTSESKVWSVAA